jgi:hypothetical protein
MIRINTSLEALRSDIADVKETHNTMSGGLKRDNEYCHCITDCPDEIPMHQCEGVSGKGSSKWKCPARGWVCDGWLEHNIASDFPAPQVFVCFMCRRATKLLNDKEKLDVELKNAKARTF